MSVMLFWETSISGEVGERGERGYVGQLVLGEVYLGEVGHVLYAGQVFDVEAQAHAEGGQALEIGDEDGALRVCLFSSRMPSSKSGSAKTTSALEPALAWVFSLSRGAGRRRSLRLA